LKRNPTRTEIETIAQTWSEHCKHKTFNSPVELSLIKNGKRKIVRFKNLFRETIVYATEKLNKKYCLSVFKDNAGIIEFDKNYGLCFKVETHNHPSAIEPYGGAETGVGGVIRDILGVGLGAKPILNTDNFCFAYPNKKYNLKKGFLTPHKIVNGVVEGVRDYGNRVGIPTVCGNVSFDDCYLYNPLVYVGCVGIIPKDCIEKKVEPGSFVFVIGGLTGKDGIGGATFSSADITEDTSSSHVQIGNAIVEKKVIDVILEARDEKLYTAITDCGAGGFSSAVGELAKDCGVCVNLEKVLLKDKEIKPWQIWLSESQERMVLVVPPKNIDRLIEICKKNDCNYYIIGEFTNNGKLTVKYNNYIVCDIDMEFLHKGLIKIKRKAIYKYPSMKNSFKKIKKSDIYDRFKSVISDLNVASKRWIIEQYDHEVIGQSVLKPFCSRNQSVPTDACVIWPSQCIGDFNLEKGFAVSHGINPRIAKISPYDMAFYCIDEAVRNILCVGADIKRAAMLDNFCSANPNKKTIMGEFVMAALGARDLAIKYSIPFISGKDSFYNQTRIGRKEYSIPTTLLISMIAPIENIRKIITSDFKSEDNPVYVIGRFLKGLGGSIYSYIFEKRNNFITSIDVSQNLKVYERVKKAMDLGYIISAHDVSDGGFVCAISEMSFGGIGFNVKIDDIVKKYNVSDIEVLFGECGSKIIVEVDKNFQKDFENLFKGIPFVKIGYTVKNRIVFNDIFDISIEEVRDLWELKNLKH